MSIKHKLLLIGGIFVSTVILLSILFFLSIQSFNRSIEENKISYQMLTHAFEGRLILGEYLLDPLDRSRRQWFILSDSLSLDIQSKTYNFSKKEEQALIKNLMQDVSDSRKIFLQLVAANESNKSGQAQEAIAKKQKTQFINELLVKSRDIFFMTDQLATIIQQDTITIQRNIIFIFVSFIASLIFIITIIILFLWKGIFVPIAQLQQGTKTIVGGEWDYHVDLKNKQDELGQLARSFNDMVEKLKKSYASSKGKEYESENIQKAMLNIAEDLQVEKEKITQELQKFTLAFDNASDHIIITDPDGIILYANKGAENSTGYSREEMIGKRPSLWGNHMPKEFYEQMWRVIKIEKKEFSGEMKNRKKNGKEYQAELKISPVFDSSGNIKFFVGVERDITKEKEVDKAKTEFVSVASHQLRTPLSTIKWYTRMLLAGDAGKLSTKQQKYLDEVDHGNQRMVDLVNSLLSVSRLELGTFVAEFEPTNVIKLVQGVIEEQKLQIDKKKIQFYFSYAQNIPLIQADPKLLRMIVQNLLSNAIKYTSEEGKVEIAISLKNNQKSILFKIVDTGCGIPKNQHDKIFMKLFRADNVRAKDTQGTGLGLYIVKSILDSFGGKIWFESEENKGSTFYVVLLIDGMKKKEGGLPN